SNGRYPVTGYNSAGEPIIDRASGYSEQGFTTFTHPLDQPVTGAARQKRTFNMYVNREPRFYASVMYSGADWIYMNSNVTVNFAFNGNSGPGLSHNYSMTGYSVRKYCDPSLNTAGNQWGTLTFPLARLGEIYLNYVEALNEYDAGNPDILYYLNQIRRRAGVPNIEDVYPDAVGNQQEMRELIRRERRVELAFENQRYFDTRTWTISPQVDRGPMQGMNIMEQSANLHTTPDNFYQRTVFETRVFENKHYLFPYSQAELDRNKQITQNYGW
ncbi:MAG TPA: RagB/SusD family nutrient uptake outer membrane protein, partial [Sphingobacterium sp.]|nr:RagB/SusD family nutrient uptake outer membrane protein [Sphingobacterium sp.]